MAHTCGLIDCLSLLHILYATFHPLFSPTLFQKSKHCHYFNDVLTQLRQELPGLQRGRKKGGHSSTFYVLEFQMKVCKYFTNRLFLALARRSKLMCGFKNIIFANQINHPLSQRPNFMPNYHVLTHGKQT